MQADDDAYTSDSRIATSPTRSLTTGVIGANEGVLVIVPEAVGPWPFDVGTVICTSKVWRGGRTIEASLRFPSRFYLSLTE